MDLAGITISGSYRNAMKAVEAQSATRNASVIPMSAEAGSGQIGTKSALAPSGTSTSIASVDYSNMSPNLQAVFTSKEASMAEVCRKVAVDGFEPIADVFSLKQW
jgi:hypothetical protein